MVAAASPVDALVELLGGGRFVELGYTLDQETPHHPNYPPFVMTLQYRHGDWSTPCGMTFASELIITTGHTGTHVDGPGHTSAGGRLRGDADAHELQRGARGMGGGFGMEGVGPSIGRGVLLDIAALHGVDRLVDDHVVTPAELEAASAGDPVLRGDAVLIRTGRGALWDQPGRYFDPAGSCPGPGAAAAAWLVDHEVSLSGTDTLTYEFIEPSMNEFGRVHLALQGAGIQIVECLNLEELSVLGVKRFLYLMAPLRITGGTGSPVRPLAWVPGLAG